MLKHYMDVVKSKKKKKNSLKKIAQFIIFPALFK